MSTAAAAPVPYPEQILRLPIGSISPSATNPRKHFDEAALAELGASIAESGIHVPLLVRLVEGRADGKQRMFQYELVAGERRWRAAKLLGLEDVPCIVREMEDDEAREAQIVENLQRADVHPMEEAEAFEELRNRLGSIAAVAAKLAKEQSYVAKCLRLLALTVWSRDALRGGLITIDHALLLARLAETEQNETLKWTLDRNAGSKTKVERVLADRLEVRKRDQADKKSKEQNYAGRFYGYVWEPETVQKLKSHIESGPGIALSRAPWKTDEEDCLLPDVVGCSECDKNTKANTPLFGDLAISDPTCTDGACFQAKTAGFVQIKLQAAGQDETAKPKKLVPRLSWKASTVKPAIVPNDIKVNSATPGRCDETANPAKLLKHGQWHEAKKGSCPNVRPGITADWSDSGDRGYGVRSAKLRKPGEMLLVCIAVGCKVHRKDFEKPKSSSPSHVERYDPAAEDRNRQEREVLAREETKIRTKIFGVMLGQLNVGSAIKAVADSIHGAPALRKKILGAFPGITGEHLSALVVFHDAFDRDLEPSSYHLAQPGGVASDRKDLWEVAKQLGVNADAIAAKHFHDSGGIAPALAKLYPKGVPWPKDAKAVAPAKKAAKPAPKKAAKKAAAKKGAKKK